MAQFYDIKSIILPHDDDELHIKCGTAEIEDGAVTDAKLAQSGGVLAEVTGIRTSADGITYASAGDAVRGQVDLLKGDVQAAVESIVDREYKISCKNYETTKTVNVSGTSRTNMLVEERVDASAGDVLHVYGKISCDYPDNYTWLGFRFNRVNSDGTASGVYYDFEAVDGVVDAYRQIPSGSDVGYLKMYMSYTYGGSESANYTDTFTSSNVSVWVNGTSLRSDVIVPIADDSILPAKLTPMTEKYSFALLANAKAPNYDTASGVFTIYDGFVIQDLETMEITKEVAEDTAITRATTTQIMNLVYRISNDTFMFLNSNYIIGIESRATDFIFLGAINSAGRGCMMFPYTIDGYPPNTDQMVADLQAYELPSEWESEVETINTAKGDRFTFAIQTDTHYVLGDSDNTASDLKRLTNFVGFDFVANLGDITQGYADETEDSDTNMRASMTEIMERYVTGISCPFMYALGNHERNTLWASATGGDPFTTAELWGRLFVPSRNTNVRAVTQTGKFWYYTDFNDVRVIVLDTQDGDGTNAFGVGSEQLSWLTGTALDTDKQVLVMSHVPLIDGWSVSSNYVSSYADVVTALQAFVTGGGSVIACLSGHTHTQEMQTVSGITYMTFKNSGGICEVVMVDTQAKTGSTIVVGSASLTGRTFSYS